jgi:hypothetical protein
LQVAPGRQVGELLLDRGFELAAGEVEERPVPPIEAELLAMSPDEVEYKAHALVGCLSEPAA